MQSFFPESWQDSDSENVAWFLFLIQDLAQGQKFHGHVKFKES
jgi:hypothetical protein